MSERMLVETQLCEFGNALKLYMCSRHKTSLRCVERSPCKSCDVPINLPSFRTFLRAANGEDGNQHCLKLLISSC
eukprot:6185533-Pleurochrysis_carterae.AAC.4